MIVNFFFFFFFSQKVFSEKEVLIGCMNEDNKILQCFDESVIDELLTICKKWVFLFIIICIYYL